MLGKRFTKCITHAKTKDWAFSSLKVIGVSSQSPPAWHRWQARGIQPGLDDKLQREWLVRAKHDLQSAWQLNWIPFLKERMAPLQITRAAADWSDDEEAPEAVEAADDADADAVRLLLSNYHASPPAFLLASVVLLSF